MSWNCQHGSLATRLRLIAPSEPDVAFVQECSPDDVSPVTFTTSKVNHRKGVALGSLSDGYRTTPIYARDGCGNAILAARVTGPTSFVVIGIWAQGPRYVTNVLNSIRAYEDILASEPSIV